MFEGDLEEGELEIGQISGLIDKIETVSDIVESIMTEFKACQTRISRINLNNQNEQ
jgi:enoyl-[acyl-carrier protein] reductase II